MIQNNQVRQFNFTLNQVAKLTIMQGQLNTYIHPEWESQKFDWETAIIDKCLEILGHLGWKWWKDKTYKQGITEANAAQIKLELIDILHFVLSSEIERDTRLDLRLAYFNSDCTTVSWDFYRDIKYLQRTVLEYGVTPGTLCRLVGLMHWLGMTEQEILETYTQKFVLNKFRQDHGYKTGQYCKEWVNYQRCGDGHAAVTMEDNQWLECTVERLKDWGSDTTDQTLLYNEFERLYNSRLNKG